MPSLDFKGKQFVYAHHLSVPFRQLEIAPGQSLPKDGKPSLNDNLIIHGDNLHALKALLPQYAGKVKCIYIDPPYNTGNEGWCYNDNVNAPLIKEWLKDSANPVDKEDLERHDKWLCMMWPRLQLLRELLADNGIILIHIDENAYCYLHLLLIEIFGKNNELGTIIWDKKNPKGDSKSISYQHESILIFAKSYENVDPLKRNKVNAAAILKKAAELYKKIGATNLDKINAEFKLWLKKQNLSGGESAYDKIDEDGNVFQSVSMAWPNKQKAPDKYFIPLRHPVSGKNCSVPERGWRNPPNTMEELLQKNLILFGNDEKTQPRRKYFLHENLKENIPSVAAYGKSDDVFLKTIELRFENPKPHLFARDLISYFTSKADIILDSFAGSGTTAHAVLALNKEDGSNRRFILVEREDYAHDITAERVRRVIKGVPNAKDPALKEGLGGSFTFCELGQAINFENLLKGDRLPAYEELARYAFYTATGLTLDKVKQGTDYFIGENKNTRMHLIYRPDLAFLRSDESALNMPLAKSISQARERRDQSALVFATHKFMGQKELTAMGMTYCQLPYAIHRIMGN